MNENLQNLFTTQEFADLCGVKKHTLFHYDELGIFPPAARGENGYRYYSMAQLEVFHVISMLKELGMPLSEIRDYLDRRSPRELVLLLREKRRELHELLETLHQTDLFLAQKADLTERALQIEPERILVRRESQQILVATEVLPLVSDRNMALSVAAHVRFCMEHGVRSAYSISAVIEREAAREKDLAGYTHFYTRVPRPPDAVPVLVRPEGYYLTGWHDRGYDEVFEAYDRLFAFAQAHELTLGACFYEDVLLDELSVCGYGSYVLQISIRLEQVDKLPAELLE